MNLHVPDLRHVIGLTMRDFRHAVRGLRKSPALTAVAVVSLALGIGANVTVFSVVREMIVDDVSASRPDRLARVDGLDVSFTQYRQLRMAGAFEDLAYYRGLHDRIWHPESHNEIAWTFTTSANFFDVFGIHAYAGRLYSQTDEGRELAVTSYGFWRKRLHGDPNALGKPLDLNGRLYTLIGVLQADYRSVYGHGVSPEVYLSDAGTLNPRDRLYGIFGRMFDNASPEQTRQALTAAVDLGKGKDAARIIRIVPMSGLRANATKDGDERLFFLFFVMLFGVSGMLLLIGCSNVAGLLVARALNRRKEMAIRKALGASRFQIGRPLLMEGLLLVMGGAALGIALDAFLRSKLSDLRWPSAYGVPIEFHFQTDSRLFLYASLRAFAALLMSSLIPALRGADADLSLAIKKGEQSLPVRRLGLRNGFVMLQAALSIVLLSLCGLFTRSLLHLASEGPGFDVSHTLIAAAHTLPGQDDSLIRQRLVNRIHNVPGVVAVTSSGILPLMGEIPDAMVRREGASLAAFRRVYVMGAGENYFATLGIPVLRGRDFEIADRGLKPIPVIVNRTLAQEFFADHDPIGRHLLIPVARRVQ